MQIVTLNTWGGRAGKEDLIGFFERYENDTDIFCLQEIWSAPYANQIGSIVGGTPLDPTKIMVHGLDEITALLPDFAQYFRPHYGDHYGLLMLVKKHIEVRVEGEIFVHKYRDYVPEGDIGRHARNIQFVTTHYSGSPLTIINFHGLWNGQGKGDSEDRLSQSEKIKEFIETLQGEVVLTGDFNLLPDTESIRILENAGLRNLVKESGVTSTRTSYYTKPEKFADYTFVSQGLAVQEFGVLPDEVSDHAPLMLRI